MCHLAEIRLQLPIDFPRDPGSQVSARLWIDCIPDQSDELSLGLYSDLLGLCGIWLNELETEALGLLEAKPFVVEVLRRRFYPPTKREPEDPAVIIWARPVEE